MKSIDAYIVTGMSCPVSPCVAALLKQNVRKVYLVGHGNWHMTLLQRFVGPRSSAWRPVFDDPRVDFLNCDNPQQSYKRKLAIDHATSDIIGFVDDDAVVQEGWAMQARTQFDVSPRTGLVSGPSLFREGSFWKRAAQTALASNDLARPRYTECKRGFCACHQIIGANMAFRTSALKGLDYDPALVTGYGEEVYLAWLLAHHKWYIYYIPEMQVIHPPHGPLGTLRRVYWAGKARTRLEKLGVTYPAVDAAFAMSIPLSMVLGVVYMMAIWGNRNKP